MGHPWEPLQQVREPVRRRSGLEGLEDVCQRDTPRLRGDKEPRIDLRGKKWRLPTVAVDVHAVVDLGDAILYAGPVLQQFTVLWDAERRGWQSGKRLSDARKIGRAGQSAAS